MARRIPPDLMKIWEALTGVPAMLVALVWLMVMVTLGTLAQAHMPLVEAQRLYFDTFIFWAGIVPVPGTASVLAFLAFGLTVQLVKQPLTLASAGSWFTHGGVLMLIFSSLMASMTMDSGYVAGTQGVATRLWQGDAPSETAAPSTWPTKGLLPFSVTVDKFTSRMHPGTSTPAYFASDVTITPDNGVAWQAKIEMNAPLRTMGYTLYQASYVMVEGQPPISILAVVKDHTRLMPYLATGLIGLGLLLTVMLRQRRKLAGLFKKIGLGVLALLVCVPVGWSEPLPADFVAKLGALPVQNQGRVKPLATVAATVVPFVTGSHMNGPASMEMLAEWLMRPSTAAEPVLAIPQEDVRHTLGLEERPGYSLAEVIPALQSHEDMMKALAALPAAKLSGPQKNLLDVQERVEVLLSVARTFALVQPMGMLDAATAKALDLPEGPVSAATLLTRRPQLLALTQDMAKTKTPSAQDVAVFQLAMALRDLQPEQPNGLLRVIPPSSLSDADGQPVWLSPWMATRQATLTADQQMAVKAWEAVLADPKAGVAMTVLGRMGDAYGNSLALRLEGLTLMYPPITLSLIPLMLALVAFGFRRMAWGLGLTLAGLALLAAGMGVRMIILGRPPVATLYESVLFVAFATVGLAAIFRKSTPAMLPVGVVLGTLLVAISHGLTQGQDTMGMLTAVLDTNFWLATHVLTITGGYAASLLVGGVALFALAQRGILRAKAPARTTTQTVLRYLTVIALLLTAVGTLLGGIWASQSWGRFWGWDPKENGALVLTLYLAVVTHIRFLKPLPYRWWLLVAAGTPVIVALSWFGVNLLNVGLHSYGFTSQLAGSLGLFCGVYGALLVGLALTDRHGVRKV